VQRLGDVPLDGDVAKLVGELGHHGRLELLEGLEVVRVAGIEAERAPAEQMLAVEERELDGRTEVVVAVVAPLMQLAGQVGLDAADEAPVARVLRGHALPEQGLDPDLVVVDRREAGAEARELGDLEQELLRAVAMQTYGQRR